MEWSVLNWGGGRERLACGDTGDGGEGERDEDDGEDRDEKVGGHVAGLVIVVVGHGRGATWSAAF